MCPGLFPVLLTPLCRRLLVSATAQGLSVVSLALLMTPLSVGQKGYNFSHYLEPCLGWVRQRGGHHCVERKPACLLSCGWGMEGASDNPNVDWEDVLLCYVHMYYTNGRVLFGDQNMKSSRAHFSISALWGTEVISPSSQMEKMLCVNTALVNLLPSDSV